MNMTQFWLKDEGIKIIKPFKEFSTDHPEINIAAHDEYQVALDRYFNKLHEGSGD